MILRYRKFWLWMGIGMLATATIPTLAAPQVAKLLQRRPAPLKTSQAPGLAKATKPAPALKPATRPTTRVIAKPSAKVTPRHAKSTKNPSPPSKKRPR